MAPLSAWYVIAAALAMDLVLGDPQGFPHPVRLMGFAADRLERGLRSRIAVRFTAGLVFAAILVAGTYLLGLAAVWAAGRVHPAARTLLEILLVYTCLSVKSLFTEAEKVHAALAGGSLHAARRQTAMLVSRDTDQMDEAGIARAAVETVAENFVDGVLSPLFFVAVLGAPGALAFKMTSTLDSMVGYKTARYERFGKPAARLDDMANWIPARLAVPIISLAAALLFGTGRRAFATSLAEGKNHKSPNAGRPEAAFAGALGVRLIGPGIYNGKRVDKPWIGAAFPLPGPSHILQACGLMLLSAMIAGGLASILAIAAL
ncbi:MAG: cobalamin biosynthesis protein CobD [Desulfobacterales bacterium]|nr:cobalamin biosynthesis protein CobD [Desulfobacterales bacterium]MBS3754871.1 cobalamin biosynthesis protein CobD [Desulfobacterales bacterium]